MGIYHKPLLVKIFLFAVALQYALPAHAQYAKNRQVNFLAVANTLTPVTKADTGTTKSDISYAPLNSAPTITNTFNDDALHLINAEVSISKFQERRQLMGYLKNITADDEVAYNESKTKFLYKLGNVFAKLRLYPLAMKCFLKASATKIPVDTLQDDHAAGQLAVNSIDDSLVTRQSILANAPGFDKIESTTTDYKNIAGTFNDGKKAVAYAMLFHVKQPVPGKRKLFVWGNTGHTFITLIKYNADSTYASFSFGFYPKKVTMFSGTPISPRAGSLLKDDANHQWDEVLGKFVSKRRFDKILALVKQYDHLEYHLSNNNCTDFGLKAAQLAGITINGTMGSWPLGHGNAPAPTGQSMLEGKISTDTGKTNDLFVNNTVVNP